MSSQDRGIPLWHSPSPTGHKLLELPPELVALLEGDNPPTLTLKPSPTSALLATTAADGTGKTYSLRQKNTSNALMLLSPTTNNTTVNTDDNTLETGPPELGLSAIATLHQTIELVPQTAAAAPSAPSARGKWHEKFGRNR